MLPELNSIKITNLLSILQARFEQNTKRHLTLEWSDIKKKLISKPNKLLSLLLMEDTGGEPDVVGFDDATQEYLFYDCCLESPVGRRNLCFDQEALESRKKFPPKSSCQQVATEIGFKILNEEEYRFLQTLGTFDTKSSSWIQTPSKIRELGGALFGDFRYGQTFIYHNGADSYYASRGFRGCLRV